MFVTKGKHVHLGTADGNLLCARSLRGTIVEGPVTCGGCLTLLRRWEEDKEVFVAKAADWVRFGVE